MTLHPFLVYIGKTAVEVERIGRKSYSYEKECNAFPDYYALVCMYF